MPIHSRHRRQQSADLTVDNHHVMLVRLQRVALPMVNRATNRGKRLLIARVWRGASKKKKAIQRTLMLRKSFAGHRSVKVRTLRWSWEVRTLTRHRCLPEHQHLPSPTKTWMRLKNRWYVFIWHSFYITFYFRRSQSNPVTESPRLRIRHKRYG